MAGGPRDRTHHHLDSRDHGRLGAAVARLLASGGGLKFPPVLFRFDVGLLSACSPGSPYCIALNTPARFNDRTQGLTRQARARRQLRRLFPACIFIVVYKRIVRSSEWVRFALPQLAVVSPVALVAGAREHRFSNDLQASWASGGLLVRRRPGIGPASAADGTTGFRNGATACPECRHGNAPQVPACARTGMMGHPLRVTGVI